MITLRAVMTLCEWRWGADWYFNPRRWATADGYVPYLVLWDYWERLHATLAFERLTLVVQGTRMANADASADRAIHADEARAFGGDV